jgi:hypothetical protein
MTEKSEIDLLYEAAAFCGFKAADGWPAELNPRQLAALMAGGFKEPHKQAWRICLKMIGDAIGAGSLATRIEQPPDKYVDKWIPHPRAESWVTGWGGIADGAWDSPRSRRGMIQASEKVTPAPIHHISAAGCAAWLHAVKKSPPEYVRAWLGDTRQEEAPKVGAGKTAPAADSRPGERRDYFRGLWLELNKPARNDGIWKAIRSRAGKDGCPIASTAGNEEFTFRYSDGGTDRLDKSIFQKDMSAVRKG